MVEKAKSVLKKFRKKLIWFVVILVIVSLIIGSYVQNKSKVYSANGKEAQTYVVKPASLKSELSLSGNVAAEEQVVLQFQSSGKLVWVGVQEGDRVKKWQALASLDQRALQKTLEKELYDFMDARWDHDQLKDDNKSQSTDAWNIYLTNELTRIAQQSQFGLNKAIIDVEIAQLSIELATLVSPIEGVVTKVDQPYAGVNITPATARFEIVNPNTLYLKTTVDQQDVVKLRRNQRAMIVFDSYPAKTYFGSIYYQSFTPDVGEENSYLVKISVPKHLSNKLRLGMGAEITITTAKKTNVLVVPFIAVDEDTKSSFVYVLKNNKKSKRKVVTGIESNDMVEIKSGLKKGEVVIY